MTEAQWLVCTNPQATVEFLRGKASNRKVRLFGCAWCRCAWSSLKDSRSRHAVEVAERFEDGRATSAELASARMAAQKAGPEFGAEREAAWAVVEILWPEPSLSNIVSGLTSAGALSCMASSRRSKRVPAGPMIPLRDIFGNPFRPVRMDPTWLAWNDGTVVKLAQAIYEDRALPNGHLDAGRLAIMADAVTEAGCQDAELLAHLRGPGLHVRGCHVLDALLGMTT